MTYRDDRGRPRPLDRFGARVRERDRGQGDGRSVGTDNAFTVLVGLLVAGLGVGAGWGLFNGFCITKLRVPALITTLGTLGAALGVGRPDHRRQRHPRRAAVADQLRRRLVPGPELHRLGRAIVVTSSSGLILQSTQFGRHTYIVGSNVEAARRAGINVDRHLLKLYALSGALAGLAGLLSLAQFAYDHDLRPQHRRDHGDHRRRARRDEPLRRHTDGWSARSIGIFIPTTLNNGFIIVNVQPFWQQVATGFHPDRRRVPRPTQAPFTRAGLTNEGGEQSALPTSPSDWRWRSLSAAIAAVSNSPRLVGVRPRTHARAVSSKYSVVYIPGLTGNPFYSTVACGAAVEAKKLGVELLECRAPRPSRSRRRRRSCKR